MVQATNYASSTVKSGRRNSGQKSINVNQTSKTMFLYNMMLVTRFIVYRKVNNRSKPLLVSHRGMHGYDVNGEESLIKQKSTLKNSYRQLTWDSGLTYPCKVRRCTVLIKNRVRFGQNIKAIKGSYLPYPPMTALLNILHPLMHTPSVCINRNDLTKPPRPICLIISDRSKKPSCTR